MSQRLVAAASESGLSNALAEWSTLLGSAHVSCDQRTLEIAGRATFATSAQVLAILRPSSRAEVQRSVLIANRFGVPLHPISSGRNWGYGTSAPVQNAVLLDLRRLNRIVEFSEELAYVTIEPGVTQRQLFEFLQNKGSRLWMDATGSSPDCSIAGNTLERGFGHTPLGDHCGNACGYEVVLPTGESIETGFGRFPGSRTAPLGRWGVGPSLDGLFSQSNLGFVTRMTVWLMPAPEYFQAFFLQTDGELGPIVDALRPLRLNGTIKSVIHIANDVKIAGGSGASGASRRRELGIGRWNGSGGLYGTRAQVREAVSLLRRALAGRIDRLQTLDDRKLHLLQRFARPYGWITGRDPARLKLLPAVYNLLKGIPTDEFVAQARPELESSGLLWCSPAAPNTGRDAKALTDLAIEVVSSHGFEPSISMSLVTERLLVTTIALTYDRRIPDGDAQALACYRTLTERLLERGYPPYRLNVSSMEYAAGDETYARTMRRLKAALDPNGVLAPGRYEPGPSEGERANRTI